MKSFLFLLLILAIVVYFYKVSKRRVPIEVKKALLFTYSRKKSIMTEAERNFFGVLNSTFGDTYYIFPQIHLSSLFEHRIHGQTWRTALNHINQKSVDYVLCDKADCRPLLAIELDDWSHDGEDRKERDQIVEGIFTQVGLPLLRLRNVRDISREELKNQVTQMLSVSAKSVEQG